MRPQSDQVQWAFFQPSEFSADERAVAWRVGAFESQDFYQGEDPPFDLDEFCLLSRGTPEARRRKALVLAERWGTLLTWCGVCHRRHIWDRVTPHPKTGHAVDLADSWRSVPRPPLRMDPPGAFLGDKGARMVRTGSEPAGDWLAWANVINAIRRVHVAHLAGRDGDAPDVAVLWPGPPLPGPTQRPAIAAVLNKWLSATCVSPAVALPTNPPGAPPIRVVTIGSVLAWFAWTLRHELTAETGAILSCPFVQPDGKVCGMTERLKRAGDKSRDLCELHYATQGKRDERTLAALLAEPPDPRPHAQTAASVEALAGRGVVISDTGETPRLVRPPAQSETEPPDQAYREWQGSDPARLVSKAEHERGRRRS